MKQLLMSSTKKLNPRYRRLGVGEIDLLTDRRNNRLRSKCTTAKSSRVMQQTEQFELIKGMFQVPSRLSAADTR